ncbi:Oidioi.mRNA.OKI2018_I69.chr2.g4365.t1.cds [Oikopleura dioica]|uniref:Oidioi.mRNA.OKI2018_I69.chr2.g4365.t1.cds n=1 Tax=Oikopleura dioica TaxID=34765 RepID=A0ABN7T1D5_OIKDI|nr:Oidioi.mRNA.OKI2018_I69.chr2.g4365.t1.cds [Oikopleura dioica]
MGPLQFIKQCEWTYAGEPCENHSEFFYDNFDWECNPMVQTCADGQYEVYKEPEVTSNELEKKENLEAWTLETTVEEPEKSESWLESRPEMQDWPVQRLLRWANRKKTRKHISSEEKKVVERIFERYGYLEKEDNQMLNDVAPVRTESIFDQFETEENENFDLGARLKEEVREVVESVSNYYFLHQKEEKDDLAVIMRLQAKVFRLREQLRTSQRKNHQLEEKLSQYEDHYFPK